MSAIKDFDRVRGRLEIKVIGEDGAVKETREVDNLVVTVGRNFIASRIVGTAAAVINWMAIGTGATAPALGDTTLQTEVARVALDSAGSATNNVCTFVATFPAGTGTGAITEAGLFNAASVGTMPCRTTFSVVNKAAGDALQITWTLTTT